MKFKEFLNYIHGELNARNMNYFMDCEYQFIVCETETSRVIKKLTLSQRDFNGQDRAYTSFLKSLEKTVKDALEKYWSVSMRVAIADTFNGHGGNLGFFEMQSPRMTEWKVSDSAKDLIVRALNQIDMGRGYRESRLHRIRRFESVSDATLQGLSDFVNEHGVCDIDVTARTNFGIVRLVQLSMDRNGLYAVSFDGEKIPMKHIRPNALIEMAEQLGVNESRSRRMERRRFGRR